jgi:DNA-binding NarL/FixJ family response regulator
MTTDPIRVLIADDHTIFREGLAALLQAAPNIHVVGEASTGGEAVEQATALSPDVILMDVMMPDLNGIDATRQIMEADASIRIVMLTMLEEDESLLAAMRAGARGYVLKGADKADLLEAIEAAAEGKAVFGPLMADRLTAFFQESDPLTGRQGPVPFPELTDREREVLDLIARGENNQAIADHLHISGKTVSNHISNIFNKLEVVDRAGAIIKAREAGLGVY